MALIVRIDVDRPYGKNPIARHVLSRVSSDLFFPRVEAFGYLRELKDILMLLNEHQAPAYVFFRQCTLPTPEIMELLDAGKHEIGLHLENSRSFETFAREKAVLEQHIGRKVRSFSKHGSGGARFGRRHYAPYEADKYINWACQAHMKVFLGNLEDPTLPSARINGSVVFPSAFWLEPHWRDTQTFSVDWLTHRARIQDVVLLIHPENVLESGELTAQLRTLVSQLETKLIS